MSNPPRSCGLVHFPEAQGLLIERRIDCLEQSLYISKLQRLRSKPEETSSVSWKDLMCLCVVLSGVFLFLYGANYYYALVGWIGIYLTVAGFLGKLLLIAWGSSKKQPNRLEDVDV